MRTPKDRGHYPGINETMELYSHFQRMGNNTVLNLELDAAEANFIREKFGRLGTFLLHRWERRLPKDGKREAEK